MGGSTGSTTESIGQLLGTGGGYQQPNQVATITQPQAQTQLLPTPEQAAAATQARMLARTPTMAAPATAPTKKPYSQRGGEGGGARGAASGGNGNGWNGY